MRTFELVLTNGRILDGCGNPWFYGDIGIKEGKIAAIGQLGTFQGARILNLDGRFVSPGFVDIHTHSDLTILINRKAESMIRQGVTTNVLGNCGMSPAPIVTERLAEMRTFWGSWVDAPEVTWDWRTFEQYLQMLEGGGLSMNLASLIGHGALRIAVMGFEERDPTKTEMDEMKQLLTEAMQAGAVGLSTGLVYPPGCFAKTEEIVELCKVVAQFGGIYASHIRGERETILEAVREAIEIGRQAGIPVQISHNAPKYGAPNDASANLQLVKDARAAGQDVTVDNDVHTDLGPLLIEGLPQPIQDKSIDEVITMLRDPQTRAEIRAEIVRDRLPAFGPVGLLKHSQYQRITILHAPQTPELAGKTLADIAQARGKDAFDVYFDLIIENGNKIDAIWDYIDEKNIRLLLQDANTMICSDGAVMASYGFLNDPPPYSPCCYGEFPGVLERYVRDEPVLTLENAIRKMTSFPARRLGLWDRGIIQPGAWADLVVFDLERIHDRATNLYPHSYPFENFPHQYPEGIDCMIVNGVIVIEDGVHTEEMPGVVIRHKPSR